MLEPWAVEAFERLWGLYPRQECRMQAFAAWRALPPTPQLADAIAAAVADRVQRGWGADGARFVPALGRFLEERRWQERWVPEPRTDRRASDGPRVPDADQTEQYLAGLRSVAR